MNDNIYQAPQSELKESVGTSEFFVVSIRKLTIMYLGTIGLYGIYWFYKHWTHYKIEHNLKMLPVARAIFAIFYVEALFAKIDKQIQEKAIDYNWNPGLLAVIFIAGSITGTVCDQLSSRDIGSPITDFLGILSLFILAPIFIKAQKAANLVCDDEAGKANNALSPANFVWLVIGALIWMLMLLGFLLIFGVIPEGIFE